MADLLIWVEAKNTENEYQRRQVAWHAACLMNMWRKKNSPAVTVDRLLNVKGEGGSFREKMRRRMKGR